MVISWSGGEEQNLTDDPSSDINPVWSPDGRFLAFLSDRSDRSRGGGYHLYTLDLLTGDLYQASEAFVMTRPVWLPASVP
jgi:Tol biopolymer transport system component